MPDRIHYMNNANITCKMQYGLYTVFLNIFRTTNTLMVRMCYQFVKNGLETTCYIFFDFVLAFGCRGGEEVSIYGRVHRYVDIDVSPV